MKGRDSGPFLGARRSSGITIHEELGSLLTSCTHCISPSANLFKNPSSELSNTNCCLSGATAGNRASFAPLAFASPCCSSSRSAGQALVTYSQSFSNAPGAGSLAMTRRPARKQSEHEADGEVCQSRARLMARCINFTFRQEKRRPRRSDDSRPDDANRLDSRLGIFIRCLSSLSHVCHLKLAPAVA